MKTTRPELRFERFLAALERDLLDVTDEEILAVANELGIKPGMKGSMALFGVTFAARLQNQDDNSERTNVACGRARAVRSSRRPKGDKPSST
jgi:hypothetical protein